VIYNSSNIDFVKEDQVFNLNSIELSTLYPDRKINAFHLYNQWGFAATNFGIVVQTAIEQGLETSACVVGNSCVLTNIDPATERFCLEIIGLVRRIGRPGELVVIV
jgi:hypothetical protein